MKKYRLKDIELQKKLDELFGHQRFSEELNAECMRTGSRGNITMCLSFNPAVNVSRDRCSYVSFYFMREDIERFVEYNPKTWNEFPEVEPPEGVWMRVEWRDGAVVRRDVARYVAWGDTNEFVWTNRGVICDVERFRPWLNDDEIEAERKAEYKKDMHPDAIAARRYMGEEDEE